MWKRFRTLVVCLLLVTSYSCGGGDGSGNTGTQETSESPETPEIAETQEVENSGPLPLFDAHAHQMPSDFPDGWLEALFSENEPEGIVLLGIGNIQEHQINHPGKVFPFANFKDLDIDIEKIDSQLKAGFYGIGEVSIRHFPAGADRHTSPPVSFDFNEPILIELYDLAKEHSVPVLFHYDYKKDEMDTMTDTLPDYPDVTFIWAHAGDAQPEELSLLMEAHDNLHIDISCRNPLESFEDRLTSKELQRLDNEDGTLEYEWAELFVEYADRVYYGSDIGPKGRLEEYAAIQDYYRGILGQLEPDVAEKIAYKNAQKLYGLSNP